MKNENKSFVRPRVDVFENDAEYLFLADVPGAAKDTIDVRFEQGELLIEAHRTAETALKPLAQETRYADYRRAFALPEGVDAEKIEAALANGVLTVHVPKSAATRARRIPIKTA